MDAVPAADKQRVEDFVQGGGGALLIAGERNVYVDHKDAPEDPLARTFPGEAGAAALAAGHLRRADHR